MKIVHALGWYFPDHVGGTEVYVAALCHRLRERGYDVAVAVPAPGAASVACSEHDGVRVFRYPIAAPATRDEAQGRVRTRGAEQLAAWLSSERPDIFHQHSVTTGLGRHEIAAARSAGARTILTHHLPSLGYVCRRGTLMQNGARACDGIVTPHKCTVCMLQARGVPAGAGHIVASMPIPISRTLGRLPGRFGTMCGLPAATVEQQAMQRELAGVCDAMVVLNDTARQMLEASGVPASRIVVNRLGHGHTNLPPRVPSAATAPIRFGFMGRLHETKGVFALARAVRQIPPAVPFSLDVRGIIQSPVEARVAAELAAIVGDDPRVRFCEAVPPEEVLGILAGFDVLCCPSTWFENGPTVAIESMAVGTPVLGTRLGNLAELIDDGVNGRLVAPNDPRALVRALTEIALDPKLVDAWRARLKPARTMDEVAAGYTALYEHLLTPPLADLAAAGAAAADR